MQMVDAVGCSCWKLHVIPLLGLQVFCRMPACSSGVTLDQPLHCLSVQDVSHPMVVVDCSSASGVKAASQLLLGGLHGLPAAADYSKSSVDVAHDALLLSALTDGTLVLNNVHKVCWQIISIHRVSPADVEHACVQVCLVSYRSMSVHHYWWHHRVCCTHTMGHLRWFVELAQRMYVLEQCLFANTALA